MKKTFATLLLAVFATSLIPFKHANSFAVLTEELPGPLMAAAITTATATGLTAAGVGIPVAAGAILGGFSTATDAACKGIEKAEEAANTVDSAFGNFAAIAGSPAQATKLTATIAALTVVKNCREAELFAVGKIPIANLIAGQEQARRQNDLSEEINALSTRIQNLKAQQTAEIKDVLRAVMVRVILNLNKTLTTNLVNKMVDKYKISDYLAYADALSSQVYSMKYIDQNYAGDSRQQMMIRSILQSKKFPEQIKTAQAFASSKAREYLTSSCQAVNSGYSDQGSGDFLNCLSAMGSEQSSPVFQFLAADDQAQVASSYGKTAAAQEVATSNGFAPPRDCSGSLSLQQNIDQQTSSASSAVASSGAVLSRLKSAYQNGQTTKEEVDKAAKDYEAQLGAFDSLPSKLNSPIVDICEAIATPSAFVAGGIGDFLKGHLEQSTQLKSDNLPFYAGFLADVATNFLTNILTGGRSTGQVLKEAGVGALNAAIIGVTQRDSTAGSSTSGGSSNVIGEVQIYVTLAGTSTRVDSMTPGTAYTLHINYGNIADERPYRMLLSGFSDGVENINLASPSVGVVRNNEFTVSFDGTAGALNLSAEFIAAPVSGTVGDRVLGTWSYQFASSRVQGAYTSQPFMPRGEAFSIR